MRTNTFWDKASLEKAVGLLVDPGWLAEATDHPKCNVSPPKVMMYRKRDQQLKENQEKEKVKETCQKDNNKQGKWENHFC